MISSCLQGLNPKIATFDSAGGAGYNSAQDWENAEDNDNVALQVSPELHVLRGAHLNINLTVAGGTSNSSYFRCIKGAKGHRHLGIPKVDGSMAAFIWTTLPTGQAWDIQEDYFQVQDLVFQYTNNQTGTRNLLFVNGANGAGFARCIAFNCSNAASGTNRIFNMEPGAGEQAHAINCIVATFTTASNQATAFRGATGTVLIYYCMGRAATSGILIGSGTVLAKNSHMSGNVTTQIQGGVTQTTCSTTAGTPVNLTNYDFRQMANTTLFNKGTNLRSDANFPVDDDIIGRQRTHSDIGPFHLSIDEKELFSPQIWGKIFTSMLRLDR